MSTVPLEAVRSQFSLTGTLVVAAVAFLVPLGLGLFPSVRVPSAVLEILVGVLIGPAVLGLMGVDLPLQVLSLIGLAVCSSWPARR